MSALTREPYTVDELRSIARGSGRDKYLAAQLLATMDALTAANERIERLEHRLAHYSDALIWCSGSEDFAQGGKAEVGWDKICRPLLESDAALDGAS